MKTQLESAREGIVTKELRIVADAENIPVDVLIKKVADGSVVIPANINHKNLVPCGIGQGLRTKINANIGTSSDYGDVDTELAKLKTVIEYKADAVMDLSTGGDIDAIRKKIIEACPIVIGSVPIYQAAVQKMANYEAVVDMTEDDLFYAIEAHCKDGMDFITVHCGLTQRAIALLKQQKRVTDIVSRGGAFLTGWMLHNQKENPLYEHYDRLLEIAHRYDVTLSLGDGLRPGCTADATDRAQIEELVTLGELVHRAREAGVQTMVEGPGHVPLNQIAANMQLQKTICENAPFYVLGPLVTDIAAGYDHITGAIGGAIAATQGASFLCYVTPAEHLGLPDIEDVKNGIIASRIAAHAADIANGIPGAAEQDLRMSVARKNLDWEGQKKECIDPIRFDAVRKNKGTDTEACSMCGKYCAMKIVEKELGLTHHGRC
jgi:phosphomethylpyrimidine synthase